MNNYKNPIEEYDPKAISAWQVADALKAALDGANSLNDWNMSAKEGYCFLAEEVKEAIRKLREIY